MGRVLVGSRVVALAVAVGLVLGGGLVRAQEPRRVAVFGVAPKAGVSADEAELFVEILLVAISQREGLSVVGSSDIQAVLDLSQQQQMLGCEEDAACLAEIGGALGVDEMVGGTLGKLGSYLVITLKRISISNAQVLGRISRSIKGGDADALVETVPSLVDELFGGPSPGRELVEAAPPVAVVEAGPEQTVTAVAEDRSYGGLELGASLAMSLEGFRGVVVDAAYRLAGGWHGPFVSLGGLTDLDGAVLYGAAGYQLSVLIGPWQPFLRAGVASSTVALMPIMALGFQAAIGETGWVALRFEGGPSDPDLQLGGDLHEGLRVLAIGGGARF